MRRIATLAIALALFIVPVASVHAAGAEPAPVTQNQKPTTSNAQPAQPVTPTAAPVIVTVQPGDSLSKIATANNTTYVRLYDANSFIIEPGLIYPGQQIRIPAADEQLPDRGLPASSAPAPTTAYAPRLTAARTAYRVRPRIVTAVSTGVPDGSAKAYIYAHESGNNAAATSPKGCYGLGQDCSGKLQAACGADYACQDAYFDNYAVARYGSWNNALAFWQANHWW